MASGRCDIVMSGVLLTPRRTMQTLYSNSYMDETLAFAVRAYRREEFNNWSDLRRRPGLRLATVNIPYYLSLVRQNLPLATVVTIDSDTLDFDERANYDAYVVPAERGAFHTMLHPGFTIVVPEPGPLKFRSPIRCPSTTSNGRESSILDRDEAEGRVLRCTVSALAPRSIHESTQAALVHYGERSAPVDRDPIRGSTDGIRGISVPH
jgi:hypothetical protein